MFFSNVYARSNRIDQQDYRLDDIAPPRRQGLQEQEWKGRPNPPMPILPPVMRRMLQFPNLAFLIRQKLFHHLIEEEEGE